MNKFKVMVLRFLKFEEGSTAKKIALILGLILFMVIVAIVAISLLGSSTSGTFKSAPTKINIDKPR